MTESSFRNRGFASIGRRVVSYLIVILIASAGSTLSGCSSTKSGSGADAEAPTARSTEPVEHWPLDPLALETELASGRIEILSERYAGAGLTGASRVELRLVDRGLTVTAKWKPVPLFLDGINNSPRKEIAAYQVQKLALDPEDYVIPTSVARCIPASEFPNPASHSGGTLPATTCELGVFSVWLDNVTLPAPLFDPERFERDPAYARHLANFNIVAYLIMHHDGREGNFLVSTNDADRVVFAVDNGVAFSGIWYNWFVPNWSELRVPALTRSSIEKLRKVRREDLRPLAVVSELRRDSEGLMTPTEASPALDEDDGARFEDPIFQFGLTESEIDDVWERIEDVLEDVDEGRIAVLD
jgi:hypothetical protein